METKLVFIHVNFSLNYTDFTELTLLFAVIWGDGDSEGGGPCHPGDECGGGHTSFLLLAEMRIPSFPQTDVVSQPPVIVGCYTRPIAPTCTASEEIKFLSLLLKRKEKESWSIKWKLAH